MRKHYSLVMGMLLLTTSVFFRQIACAQTFASVHRTGQNVKKTDKQVSQSLETTLQELEKRYGVFFLYDNQKIKDHRVVFSIEGKEKIEKLLNRLLKPLELTYKKVGNIYAIVPKGDVEVIREIKNRTSGYDESVISIPQEKLAELVGSNRFSNRVKDNITVRGKVTDDLGETLPGVSVVVKGTSIGTSTSEKGDFALDAPDNAVLVFTFIGYTNEEIAINGRTTINVTLVPDIKALSEVVVVGYGTQKKVSVTGAVAQTEGKVIKTAPVPAISNALVGRLPGLIGSNTTGEPGYDDASILIRGASTTGNSAPLVVVDGVPDRAGGFSRIDANDVESVTILKDASAAIYGARAANGVILVTTKRGKSGKTQVNYSFNYGLRQPTRLPKMLNSADYAVATNELNAFNGAAPKYTADDIQKFRDGSDPIGHPNTNWLDETLKPVSPQIQHNLSVNGGSEKAKYYFSLGHQFQDGYYRAGATKYFQYNVRSNIDVQVHKNFKIFLNLSARQEDRNYAQVNSEDIFRYSIAAFPTALAKYPNGLWAPSIEGDWNPAALATGISGYQKDKRLILNGDIGFTLDLPTITQGLSVIGGAYFDRSDKFYKRFYKKFNLYQKNGDNYDVIQRGANDTRLDESMEQNLAITANVRLNYSRVFNDVHDITGFVAYELSNSRFDYLYGYRDRGISTDLDQLFMGGTQPSDINNDGYANETARRNYFGRVGYGFSDKYLFQFNWRYDGSQNFPQGKQYGFFPGVSVGWRLSEENFWKENIPLVNNFKIRASWGQLGNDQIPAYQFLSTYAIDGSLAAVFGGAAPQRYPGSRSTRTPNPNVTWEVANTTNLGIEGQLFNNMIGFEVDVFHTKRTNILATRDQAVPAYSGLTLPPENLGIAENRGIEFSLNYKKTFGDFKFQVSGNLTYYKSKVLSIQEPEGVLAWQRRTGLIIGTDDLPMMLHAIGIFQNQAQVDSTPRVADSKPGDVIFQDVNGDKIIDGKDMIRANKSSTPRLVYGINFNLGYKGFDLSMLWQGQGLASQYVFFQSGLIGNFPQEYFDNRFIDEANPGSGPRLYDRTSSPSTRFTSDYFLRDASFIRLKTVELSYTFSPSLFAKMPFSALRLYVSGFNLLTFDKLKYVDPEARRNGQNYIGWSTPQTRVFNAGINVTF